MNPTRRAADLVRLVFFVGGVGGGGGVQAHPRMISNLYSRALARADPN